MPGRINMGPGDTVEAFPPLSKPALAIAAISAAAAATVDLAEFVHHRPDHAEPFATDETVENMADALKLTIEASGREDDEAMQLLGACSKFLEGWA